ncbi:MAG TPA: patatin-like phospholipase family protein, partial [Bryobacteraceae bacterium]|nr:patatin-like phospholipase family protein [Bryobacteraceae bacterium]
MHSLLQACVSYADTFPEDEYFYAGNIAGRGEVISDSTAVRRMLEWVSENGTGLIEDCGIGIDKIRYFRLGPNGRQMLLEHQHEIEPGKLISGEELFLSLSGGGLRATIFHLGVMLFLSTSKHLDKVRGIVSVSGGSILAAHIVNHWQDATGSEEGFARVAADLIAFIRTDIRHRVFVPWLWSRLVPLHWWRRSKSRTARLRAIYDEHFGAQGLGGMAADRRPFLALVATDSIKQERIAFTPKEILRFPIIAATDGRPTPKDAVHGIIAGGVPLSLAVAASSCFPPVFPRLRLTNHDLGLNYEDFKEILSVNDGGVTDNLGLEVLLALKGKGQNLGDRVVVCDVERPMRDKPGDGPMADQAAQATALSKAAEARIVAEAGRSCTFIRISHRPALPLAVPFAVQTKLAVFRTDLDAPTWQEIQALLLHGFSCAAGALAEEDYASLAAETSRSRVAEILQLAGCKEDVREPSASDLDRSHSRPMRRIAIHAALILSAFVAAAGGAYAVWVKTNGSSDSTAINLSSLRKPVLTTPVPAEGMREATFLPEIDYRPFEMKTFAVSVDMRLWKPHLAAELGQKTS